MNTINIKNKLKIIFSSVLFVLFSLSAHACFRGCVVDKCSGEPLVNYPITYCEPGMPLSGCTTIITGPDGCFIYYGSVGSSIFIGGTTSTYYGGPCNDLGTVSAYGLTGSIGVLGPNNGYTPLFQRSPLDVGVNNVKVTDCGDALNQQFLGFGYMAPDIDLSNYCVKIDVYQVALKGQRIELIQNIDWTPYYDIRDMEVNSQMDFVHVLRTLKAKKGIYMVRVSIKCCGSKNPLPQSGINVFSGSFVWNPAVAAADIEFNWTGSDITEVVNKDGNIEDHLHPNDGTVWQLGAASVGVVWANSITGSAAVTKIEYTLIKDENCMGTNLTTIKKQTVFPASGELVNNLLFNSWTGNYFVLGGPLIYHGGENHENEFTIEYTYDDCFKFIVKVWGSLDCPPKEVSGRFKIYDGDASARVADGGLNDHINSAYLMGDDGSVELRSISKLTKSIYPNPTSGVITLENFNAEPSLIQLYDSQGRIQSVKIDNNQVDMSHLPSGVYYLHTPDDKLGRRVDKVIKI